MVLKPRVGFTHYFCERGFGCLVHPSGADSDKAQQQLQVQTDVVPTYLILRANDTERALIQSTSAAYSNGDVSQLELPDAQSSELRSRRQALQVRAAQVQATVSLIRALGGGWVEGLGMLLKK